MVLDYKIEVIIMLCNLEEDGRSKCHAYWPQSSKKDKIIKGYSISLIKEEKPLNNSFLYERHFLIRKDKEDTGCEVTQLHYTGWPDHGVPEAKTSFNEMEYMFKYTKKKFGEKPILAHCSAGVGRTGTYICSYTIWDKLEEYISLKKQEKDKQIEPIGGMSFSIFETVRLLKECRCYSVQSSSQYKYIYNLIAHHLKKYIKK